MSPNKPCLDRTTVEAPWQIRREFQISSFTDENEQPTITDMHLYTMALDRVRALMVGTYPLNYINSGVKSLILSNIGAGMDC